jgi:hypothetical protein
VEALDRGDRAEEIIMPLSAGESSPDAGVRERNCPEQRRS